MKYVLCVLGGWAAVGYWSAMWFWPLQLSIVLLVAMFLGSLYLAYFIWPYEKD